MKKLLVLLCAITLSVYSNAQGLGDYMEIDGVPGFVFHVDDSGEHGLVMSFYQLDEKDAKSWVKKGRLTQDSANKLCLSQDKKKKSNKEMTEYYKQLIPLLSDDGEQNAIVIKDFCQKNNLELDVFPEQSFAANLGEGWFIPGDKELKFFAEFYAGGLGKNYGFKSGYNHFVKRPKELSNDASVQYAIMYIAFKGLGSSTMKHADSGFRALIHLFKLHKDYWEILDEISNRPVQKAAKVKVCAVHKF